MKVLEEYIIALAKQYALIIVATWALVELIRGCPFFGKWLKKLKVKGENIAFWVGTGLTAWGIIVNFFPWQTSADVFVILVISFIAVQKAKDAHKHVMNDLTIFGIKL